MGDYSKGISSLTHRALSIQTKFSLNDMRASSGVLDFNCLNLANDWMAFSKCSWYFYYRYNHVIYAKLYYDCSTEFCQHFLIISGFKKIALIGPVTGDQTPVV